MKKTDQYGWPIWKHSAPILRDAVLFIDRNNTIRGWDKTIEHFHKIAKVAMPLEEFKIEVENLYYAPTATH